ncbi:hypothetical protein [Hymenobacter wooponensis]|uniref:Glycosyltransferase RgtA/B/C/D-like domain-containing protein n=1 Tax=Hymenobacter wooponensis TaxID=1525360 RepID=A0A4Z0MUS5_9BACT|nr:hypothetical protein [Hymenobacter wooponensis]TGD83007.1 hypothetical protein EU557_04300 [Hymenobacter wooponensis]
MLVDAKMSSRIAIAALISIFIRIILFFIIYKGSLLLNPDDEGVFYIAKNYIEGHGYTVLRNGIYEPSAFHASTPVFIYKWLIQAGISKNAWSLFICIFSLFTFFISAFYFYNLCVKFLNGRVAFFATLTYLFYPSVLIYVGTCITYENFVMPMLVITVFLLVHTYQKGEMKLNDFLLLLLLSCISCIFKSNVLSVYVILFFLSTVMNLFKRRYGLAVSLSIISVIVSIVHIPVLIKNKDLFGEYILSTQSGYELLQGHNPTARGSWMGNWREKSSPIYKYAHENIVGIDNMNEFEESIARKKLAVQWIKSNPLQEVVLLVRKSIIYFIPQNLEIVRTSSFYNPINFAVHILFISMVLYLILTKSVYEEDFILIAPFIGSFAVTLLYFVGYRWRYYAEPFMILYAWRMIDVMNQYYNAKRQMSQLK